MRKIASFALIGALALTTLSGCSWTPKTEHGALVGGAIGAGVGALATHSVGGAVVGAGVGAASGYFLAKNSYRCKKINLFGQPYWGWCLK